MSCTAIDDEDGERGVIYWQPLYESPHPHLFRCETIFFGQGKVEENATRQMNACYLSNLDSANLFLSQEEAGHYNKSELSSWLITLVFVIVLVLL